MDIEEVLQELGNDLLADLIESQNQKGLRASGKSARETRVVISEAGTTKILEIIGPDYWQQQEKGRGPTRQGAPKGDPSLVEALKIWAEQKGLTINPYALAKRIHKEGIKVPNRYNPGGVVRDALGQEHVLPIASERLREGTIKDFTSLLFEGL